MIYEYRVDSEAETLEVAKLLGAELAAKGVVYLDGTLGAGKTTFSRGILRSYGYQGAVKSPTFTLVEPYDLQWGQVYHFDLYRIADPEELEFLGIDDYLAGGHLCLIEWSERGSGFLPPADLRVELVPQGMGRDIKFEGHSSRGESICERMALALQGLAGIARVTATTAPQAAT
jgi:tRNA threonylcarbamoyladenosine biosynthesis protein TsaE